MYWPQRKTILETAKQSFFFALRDGKAHNLRKQTQFLFLYYVFIFSLFSFANLLHIQRLYLLAGILFASYSICTIGKNYHYVKNPLVMFYLPILQIISDAAVLSGTSIGFIKSFSLKTFFGFIRHNWQIICLTSFYVIVVLTGITWGIPNNNHPFNYHMDEWAQAQSIRSLFRHGSPNLGGSSSHGAIFQFFLSGIYLIPFMLLHLVNPFIIKSSLEHIEMQQRLFIILRLNTLLFGIGSIIIIAKIAKKYLKTYSLLPVLLFTITPIFLALSTYFKYDIALAFWISLSLLFAFRYATTPTLRNFLLYGLISALACATKVSALPLFPIYISSFFLFTSQKIQKYYFLPIGIILFVLTFLIAGVPDIIFSKNEYLPWLNSNIGSGTTAGAENFIFHIPYWIYLPIQNYPVLFGKIFYLFFIISAILWAGIITRDIFNKNLEHKKQLFLLLSLFLFILSLFPLKMGAVGNRLMVLLPYFSLLTGNLISLFIFKSPKYKNIFIFIFIVCVIYQTGESLALISTRLGPDPFDKSSLWMQKNIPEGKSIGVEPIPIFQFVPNLVLKEFYQKLYNMPVKNNYTYQEVTTNTKNFPSIVIIGNVDIIRKYMKKSPKNSLVHALETKGYKKIVTFTPDFHYYLFFNTKDSYYFNWLVAYPMSITFFEKNTTQ